MKTLYYLTTYPFDEAVDVGMWFFNLFEKSWKYEHFWKWYYRLVPIGVIILWIFMLLNPELFSNEILI